MDEVVIAAKRRGWPGYAAISDYPEDAVEFKRLGYGVVQTTRSDAVSGFNEYADAKIRRNFQAQNHKDLEQMGFSL